VTRNGQRESCHALRQKDKRRRSAVRSRLGDSRPGGLRRGHRVSERKRCSAQQLTSPDLQHSSGRLDVHTKTTLTTDTWNQCLQAGGVVMRRPYAVPETRQRGLPELVMYHIPGFDPAHSWSVYRTGRSTMLHSIRWDQRADGRRIFGAMSDTTPPWPAPTLVQTTFEIDGAWWDSALSQFAALRIPLATHRVTGSDGETYGIHRPREFEIEWCSDGPLEWADISRWTRECMTRLRTGATQRQPP